MNSISTTIEATVPLTLVQSSGEYLSFRLGREEYGIDILNVQEIRGYDEPTRMFSAQPFVKGVVNLRGVIVPIVDLRIKFGLSDVVYDGLTITIVLNIGQRVVGVVVDSVSDVIELNSANIQPAPECSSAMETDHIIGLGTVQNAATTRMLILLDIQKLMSSADMGLISQTMQ